jgi:hypothetical protein
MNHPNRQPNPRLRPLAPAFRRPLLRSLVTGRPARIGAIEPRVRGPATT